MKIASSQIIQTAGLVVGWGLALGFGFLLWKGGREPAPDGMIAPQEEKGAPVDPRFAPLAKAVEALEWEEGFEAADIAICVLDGSGNPVVEHRADRSIIPASTLKTVTTATALEKLGPDFRFKTLLQGTAPFGESPEIYPGDLVILGGGDPSFKTEALIHWAEWLAARGITKIDGKVIGDGQIFPELIAANAWDWGDVGNYYGAPACGLNIDNNGFTAMFRPGAAIGARASLAQISPEVPGVEIINLMLTCGEDRDAADTPYVYGGAYSPMLTFRGAIRMGHEEEAVHGSIPDPARAAADRLARILSQRGIKITGGSTTVRQLGLEGKEPPKGTQTGIIHQSDPLLDLIRHTHEESDNLYAECLFRLLALDSETRDGREVIERHWSARGLTFKGLRLEDGSGLARADLIRPIDLALLNHFARHGPQGEAFLSTLNRPYEKEVWWKGGAMSRVRAYVGFVGDYTFVLAMNHFDASPKKVSEARDRLMKLLMIAAGV